LAIRGRLGLHFDVDKLSLLGEILGRRAEANGHTPTSYIRAIEARGEADGEIGTLAEALTVTETYFFRNAEQFRALVEVVIPSRTPTQPPGSPLRILSAGCASGEEAYSLAMLARDRPELAGVRVSVIGVDVNPSALERAAKARYSSWALRETSPEAQARFFHNDGREFLLDGEVRASVTFQRRNLIEDDPAFWRPGSFDVVFCRNVLMYFAPDTAQAVVTRFSRSLVPGGFLFLGYAETMRGLSQDFHLRHTHGTFYYQKRDSTNARGYEIFDQGFAALPRDLPPPSRYDSSSSNHGLVRDGLDQSWIESIRHSSERVESLTSRAQSDASRAARLDVTKRARERPSFDLSRVVDLMRQERFGEAGAVLAELPPESTHDADVLLLRAVLLTHGGDLAAAETLCREVLMLDEMSAGAHYLTALCREDARDRVGAADHDRVAVYLDPSFAMPRLHLGLLARRGGDFGAARRELVEALALLQREDTSRLLLFGGGFGREGLIALCRAELRSCGAAS
jgi:chemotaxis protein methyltransferase CheR